VKGRRAFPAVVLGAACLISSVAYAQDPAKPDISFSPTQSFTAPTPQGDRAQGEKLAYEEKKDSGRIFEVFWADVEGGFSYINMQQFSSSSLQIQNATAWGGMLGLGAGVRLLVFTLGVRARLNELSAFDFWEINGEVGCHIPIKKWDPYFALHGGYTFVGSLTSSAAGDSASMPASDISVHGADAGLSVGLDYYFLSVLSLGLDVTGEGLFLSRPPAALPSGFDQLPAAEQNMIKSQPIYSASGDSVGFGVSGSLHLGLHL
jgi:hypothetical protein